MKPAVSPAIRYWFSGSEQRANTFSFSIDVNGNEPTYTILVKESIINHHLVLLSLQERTRTEPFQLHWKSLQLYYVV